MRKHTDNMLGESNALADALDHISQLASIQRPVLVVGERGTGKELAAERLHYLSPRWDGPFVKVNCAAMAETLLESELFGHESGAFTGAIKQHIGRFERADGGTLLLDEIGTTSPRLQEKLLRLIEYGEFERVGGQSTLSVDVRIVGATNADLRQMAADLSFRADLLDRLSFDVVHMPALRHRGDDAALLANHFAIQMSAELGWELFPGFSGDVLSQLRSHSWPGNVRELKNVVERSLHRWGTEDEEVAELIVDPFANPYEIDARDQHGSADDPEALRLDNERGGPSSPPQAQDSLLNTPKLPLRDAVRAYEKHLLEETLQRHDDSQRRSAETLGLSYDQIRGLMRKHGLRTRRPRKN